MVEPGDDLADVICCVAETNGPELVDHDVVVLAQKVVSKAEGQYVELAAVKPGPQALALSVKVQKDPSLVEVILSESRRVVRYRPGVLIVEHRLGFVVANAGVDQSNVDPAKGTEPVLRLPKDLDSRRSVCTSDFANGSARRSAWSSTTVLGVHGALAQWASRSAQPVCRR